MVTFFVALYNQVRVSEIRNSSNIGNNGSENLLCGEIFPGKAHYNKCFNICLANRTGEVSR